MRKTIALSAVAALTSGLAVFGAAPAMACTAPNGGACADTAVTFTIQGGGLSISAPSGSPTAVPLTSAGLLSLTGTSVSGQLGTTTVTDTRGLATGGWTVVMTSTNFSDGAGHTIPASAATGYSGAVTPSGTVIPSPTLTAPAGASLAAPTGTTIVTAASILGANSASYNPTVSVAIPANAVAATYTGTVTQSVS